MGFGVWGPGTRISRSAWYVALASSSAPRAVVPFEAWFCDDRVGDGPVSEEEGSTGRARPCAFEEHDRV